jgi:hypothetical protein
MKVYVIDVIEYRRETEDLKGIESDPTKLSDKEFMKVAENTGWVLTLQEYQEEFNGGSIVVDRDRHYLRFIAGVTDSCEFWKARYEVQKELVEDRDQELNDLKEAVKDSIAKIRELANKFNLWKL